MEDYQCQSCGVRKAKQQTGLGELPHILIVHINKWAVAGPSVGTSLRLSGAQLRRIAVVHHTGQTPTSGHYTCTVTTRSKQTYLCNDETITPKPELSAQAWDNSYLIFLETDQRGDLHPAQLEAEDEQGEDYNDNDDNQDSGEDSCVDANHTEAGADCNSNQDAEGRDPIYRLGLAQIRKHGTGLWKWNTHTGLWGGRSSSWTMKNHHRWNRNAVYGSGTRAHD